MPKNVDESQTTQENKTPLAEEEGEKKNTALSKEGVERDQPLVIEVEEGEAESRTVPAGSGREGKERGRSGILDKIRGLSTEARYRIGNIGLILVQALLFLVANFFAKFPGWWAERSALEAMVISLGYVVPFFFFLFIYSASVSGREKELPRWIRGLVAVAIVAALPAGVEGFATSGVVNSLWWRGTALAIGTVCQGVAGYIAWKAAGLIPTPSAEKNSNEDGEE